MGGRTRTRTATTAIARGIVNALEPPRVLEFDTDIHGRLRWERASDGDGTFLPSSRRPSYRRTTSGGTIDWVSWSEAHEPAWDRIRAGYEARAA